VAVSLDRARDRMVATQLEARGIADVRVLAAMRRVPRHEFVDPSLLAHAYDDTPLPIGYDQTISQPYIVALMSEALELPERGARVLEVGTGSGYQAAVLAALGAHGTSIERLPVLADMARRRLAALGFGDAIQVEVSDGTEGWAAMAPYDAILVSAGAPALPRPLVEQLAPGGCLVLPIGDRDEQVLVRLRRTADGVLAEEYLGHCRFVELKGVHGWRDG
jgi:protein-L-isoaspartate(D-aspartate) O-methyltransferase